VREETEKLDKGRKKGSNWAVLDMKNVVGKLKQKFKA